LICGLLLYEFEIASVSYTKMPVAGVYWLMWKPIINRIMAFPGRWRDLRESDPSAEDPSAIAISLFASMACLGLLSGVAAPGVAWLTMRWFWWLAYTLIPMSVTAILLYRSCWQPGPSRVARAFLLILLSGLILIGAVLAIGILLAAGCFYVRGLETDMGPG
jgi:hypothetical protein